MTISEATALLKEKIKSAPHLGDLSVRDLACMSIGRSKKDPVGIYIFGNDEGDIYYVGKTHGRSLHERMITHLDSRDPVPGSPHLAQLVSSQVKREKSLHRSDAVKRILDMNMLWIAIPKSGLTKNEHQRLIALVERRLLWCEALDPSFNSDRVKRNSTITIKGKKVDLLSESRLFSLSLSV